MRYGCPQLWKLPFYGSGIVIYGTKWQMKAYLNFTPEMLAELKHTSEPADISFGWRDYPGRKKHVPSRPVRGQGKETGGRR